MQRPDVSLVIPVFNEEDVLPRLDVSLHELLDKAGVSSEVLFVDDGSKDRSLEVLRGMVAREPRYGVVSLSRNFGHQRAITCGMNASRGKAVIVMDADLGDPHEVVLEMLAKWREGFDVVYGRPRSPSGQTGFKVLAAKVFYRLFKPLIPIDVPLDAGNLRLMSRRVIVAMRGLRETHRFGRGLVAWSGFKQTTLEYDRAAGSARRTPPLRKLLAFGFDGIASFSILPLRMATGLGMIASAASILYGIFAIVAYLAGTTVEGWTLLAALVSLLFSVQLLVTGVLGEYIGRIYEQVKGRPLYVVGERIRHRRMRARAETQDFGSPGEASQAPTGSEPIRGPTTDRPPMGAPPPASGAAPTASSAPPPLPAKAGASNPPPPSTSPPPPLARTSGSIPAASPASVAPKAGSRPPPPLPSAAKKSDKT